MVYVRNNNSSWVLYDIVRDYQGSITHLVDDSDGTVVAEYSYDPWGRMRDPETLAIYTPGSVSSPTLLLGRGYTGHEHLDWFGLINMNARLYDPALGRFLSPDPYVQAPDFSQNFNRYSYCLNNPLKYTDPTGEVFGLDDFLLAAVIGGAINWLFNGAELSWKGLGYFAGGALVGGLSAGAGAWIASTFNACGVFAGTLVGSTTGVLTGGATSFLSNGLNNLVAGNNFFDNWWSATSSGMITGAIMGGISGGIKGYKYAKENGANPWNRNYIETDNPQFPDKVQTTVDATSEKTPTLQPNKTRHCYGYADEFADQGRNNHSADDFLKAVDYIDGENPLVAYNKVNGTTYRMSIFRRTDIRSLSYHIKNNADIITVTGNHAMNVRGITYGFRIRMFGGNIGNKLVLFSARVHDPLIGGYRSIGYLQTVGIIR